MLWLQSLSVGENAALSAIYGEPIRIDIALKYGWFINISSNQRHESGETNPDKHSIALQSTYLYLREMEN